MWNDYSSRKETSETVVDNQQTVINGEYNFDTEFCNIERVNIGKFYRCGRLLDVVQIDDDTFYCFRLATVLGGNANLCSQHALY